LRNYFFIANCVGCWIKNPGECVIKDVPMKAFIKKNYRNSLECIFNSIDSGESLKENIYTEFNFPKKMYLAMGSKGWYKSAKLNGISKERLFDRPYEIK